MEQLEVNKIILGDCLEKLKELPENSIDSIVTDPPYELGFMGKSWDSTGIANNVEMWKECLRVLKPGGHLLAFGGTRTYHRMVVAIEDAGFEVRDMIEWVYGCLSFDTEVLTERGFRRLHKLTQYDRIAAYDIEKNIYKWERPQRWNIYQVHEDTAYRIKSDFTDQIVSRNHRCLVEREGKLVFIQAEELLEMEYMPTLSDDFLALQKNSTRTLLFKNLLWKSKGLAQKVFGKWIGKEMPSEGSKDGEKSSLERWSNLFSQTRQLQTDKVCAVSEAIFADGTKRRLCNGTSFDFSKLNKALPVENGSSASYQSRPTGQQTGKSDVISIKQGTQVTRRARIEKIKYSGIIFCPTVSTCAFVARRNGQVFITGNSGFPKSRNITLDMDKMEGHPNRGHRIAVANRYHPDGTLEPNGEILPAYEPKSDNAKKWNGWGTALKPAHEPICMARKPLSEKSVAENVLKYGTGGINIDESRVESNEKIEQGREGRSIANSTSYHDGLKPIERTYQNARFPANLIHDNSEEVRECFPESTSTANIRYNKASKNIAMSGENLGHVSSGHNDQGNSSRFFKSIIYQAKSSKSDRNSNGVVKNFHPTCKPIALMEYLIKMVTPEGGVVLDPFAGSGSTLVAAKKNDFNFIGIEREPEYVKIAEARIAACKPNKQQVLI